MDRKINKYVRLAVCKRSATDIPVKGDLAVTPAQMERMRENGVAISSQMAGRFSDGQPNPSWDVPINDIRGIDIADLWEAQVSSRFNIKDTIAANKRKYGDSTVSSV